MTTLTDEHQMIYDLRVQIKQLHATMGRMFEKGLITADMIAEALDRKATGDDADKLKVIFNSWGGNAHYNVAAIEQFRLILLTIRSYQ